MLRNLAVFCASLVVGFLLIETISRFFVTLPAPYVNAPELVVHDRRGFWILRPGYTGTMDNAADFRGKRITVGEDGGRDVPCRRDATGDARVVLLGDSQTFGQGLADDETWASRLQCMLNAAGRPYRVFNLGVPGTNIDTYARRLAQVLPALEPGDRVIVAVTWNDLHSFEPATSVAGAAAYLTVVPTGADAHSMAADPVRPYRLLRKPTWRYRLFRSTGLFVPSFDGLKGFMDSMMFSSAAFHVAYPRMKEIFYRYRPPDAVFRKIPDGTFENNFRFLAIMRDAVARTRAAMMVVFLPNRIFFDRTYYEAYSQGGTVFPDRDFPGALARRFCPAENLECVSMFPYLRTDRRDAHTFPFDGHYNEAGARRVAEGVFTELFEPRR